MKWFPWLTCLALMACNGYVMQSEQWKFENAQWAFGDKKSLTLNATDTSTVYALNVEVKHLENYAFQNLYIRTLTTYPSGKEVTSVTSLELSNNDGTWSGDCGGGSCTVELPLQKKFTFPETGTFTWTIEPYMRLDTVKGIERLKVECIRVKQ